MWQVAACTASTQAASICRIRKWSWCCNRHSTLTQRCIGLDAGRVQRIGDQSGQIQCSRNTCAISMTRTPTCSAVRYTRPGQCRTRSLPGLRRNELRMLRAHITLCSGETSSAQLMKSDLVPSGATIQSLKQQHRSAQ